MYLGSFKEKFTGRGRVVLPKEVRKLAGNRIVLKYGLDGCVEGYGIKDWEKTSQRRDLGQDERQRFESRLFFANSRLIELDTQGRFVIPPDMLKFGKIRNVVIIGVGDHFEIWDLNIWQRHINRIGGANG